MTRRLLKRGSIPSRRAMLADHKARSIFAPLVLGFVISACNAVNITEPKNAYSSAAGGYVASHLPITEFVVLLGSRYASGFEADLDGVPITSWFTPAAAPNTTVTAQVPSCFSGGTQLAPNIVFKHDLVARAYSTTSGTSFVNDIVEFVPPSMQFQPSQGINISRGQTVTVLMNLTGGQATNVPVTLEPNSSRVSVNGAPSGTPAAGMIPDNNVGTFTITGVAPGSFIVLAKARGVQCGGVSGSVR